MHATQCVQAAPAPRAAMTCSLVNMSLSRLRRLIQEAAHDGMRSGGLLRPQAAQQLHGRGEETEASEGAHHKDRRFHESHESNACAASKNEASAVLVIVLSRV